MPSIDSRNPWNALPSLNQRIKTHVPIMHDWIHQVHSPIPTSWRLLVFPPADQNSPEDRGSFIQSLIPPEKGFFYRLLEMGTETSKALQPLSSPPASTICYPSLSTSACISPHFTTPVQFPFPSKTELKGSRSSSF